MKEKSIKEQLEEKIALYKIEENDLKSIHTFGEIIKPDIPAFVSAFYDWLEPKPEYKLFFQDTKLLEHVKEMQIKYWETFFQGKVDEDYYKSRIKVGSIHAAIKLPLQIYFAAMSFIGQYLIDYTLAHIQNDAEQKATAIILKKLIDLDISCIVEVYTKESIRSLEEQHKQIEELSMPVINLMNETLLLPVIGSLDSNRAMTMMSKLLDGIHESRSRVAIIDLTGIRNVASDVGKYLIDTIHAVKLLGADLLITGITVELAEIIATLEFELLDVKTFSSLGAGIRYITEELKIAN